MDIKDCEGKIVVLVEADTNREILVGRLTLSKDGKSAQVADVANGNEFNFYLDRLSGVMLGEWLPIVRIWQTALKGAESLV